MKRLRKMIMATLFPAMACAALPAHAIYLELGLLIDGSGSISGENFNLQRNAYINSLADASILPRDGSIAVGIWQFAGTGTSPFTPLITQVFAPRIIGSASDITALQAALAGMTQLTGSTATGPAILMASGALLGNAIESDRQVLDVSTDGADNVGISDILAAQQAVASGIDQINCLGVGPLAECDFQAGAGSFAAEADTFADYEAILRAKLTREIGGGTVPEPASALLAGLGLLGLGYVRRTRRV